ncbi:hypothetical protein [Streptomyces sp. NPDC048508]|uniref:hypothetical protein n=1 Tax=Streptomyces sp. NPDC048508 TaxID=3365561 RepID=UPI00370FBF52
MKDAEDPAVNASPNLPVEFSAEYSATVLASHWVDAPTLTNSGMAGSMQSGGIEGATLRFGPGIPVVSGQDTVTAMKSRVHKGFYPSAPASKRGWRQYILAATILFFTLSFIVWQRYGSSLEVQEVVVRPISEISCGATANIMAKVQTNGRPGVLSYRWVRNDGSTSEVLKQRIFRGTRDVELHLRWTFQGVGSYAARAEIQVFTPRHLKRRVNFLYKCP